MTHLCRFSQYRTALPSLPKMRDQFSRNRFSRSLWTRVPAANTEAMPQWSNASARPVSVQFSNSQQPSPLALRKPGAVSLPPGAPGAPSIGAA
jgi:hypothetical protein